MDNQETQNTTTGEKAPFTRSDCSDWEFLWCDEEQHDDAIETQTEVKWYRRNYKGTLAQAARKFEQWAAYRYVLLDGEIKRTDGTVRYLDDCGLTQFGR